MEAFTLLKYWCTGGGTAALFNGDSIFNAINPAAATPCSDYGFDGPFFDMEFTLTDHNQEATDESLETTETESESEAEDLSETGDDDEEGKEREVRFSLTSDETEDQNLTLPVSLLKSATKINRVLLLKLKKSNSSNGILEKDEKSEKAEANGRFYSTQITDDRENQDRVSDKMHRLKFDLEEVKGPLISLFSRDDACHGEGLKHNLQQSDRDSVSDKRNLGKEMLHKYLNRLKPLYIRVPRRLAEKMKLSGKLVSFGGGPECGGEVYPPCSEAEKGYFVVPKGPSSTAKSRNNLQAGLKVMRKHLGKSRSTSAMAAVSPPGMMGSNRRDDSLDDGIQGAISHCKRSFNSNRDEFAEGESAIFSRSVSDQSYDKSVTSPEVS